MATFYQLKIRAACSECGEPLTIDGPIRTVRCLACQSSIPIDTIYWKRIMAWRNSEEARGGATSTAVGLAGLLPMNVRMQQQWPLCAECERPLQLEGVAPGMDRDVPCACGHATPTFPAPAWLAQLDPQAAQLFDAEREGVERKAPVVPQASHPVSFGCPDCGANLKITTESPRILPCQYCKADLFLPDPLWRALHPVKKRRPWYLAFV